MLKYLANDAQVSVRKWIGHDIHCAEFDICIGERPAIVLDYRRNNVTTDVTNSRRHETSPDLEITTTQINDAPHLLRVDERADELYIGFNNIGP